MNLEHVNEIVKKHTGRGRIITILEEIQKKYSYLPEEALRFVSTTTGHPLVDLYGVATFYKLFTLKPRGKHLLVACSGTACHVRGAPAVSGEISRQLGIPPGETTPDGEISFETVNCLGACAVGPVVVVDGRCFPRVARRDIKELIRKTRIGLDRVDVSTDQRVFPVEVSCPHCNHSLMDKNYRIDGHPSIKVTIAAGATHGWLRLSCLYGSFSVDSEHPVPENAVTDFFCPHCHGELTGTSPCDRCGAPLVPMLVRGGGGMVQVCSRRGCRGHVLDLSGVA
ncbi:MAG TPA: NAD(P)H-dependent oxidoreductase subunit E [Thermodesulfobacteriota bacterium]|nr:NAD(P)H-dependent oxidoreductase subunit E [Thermodesulfobacteriota bacterium]